MKRLIPSLIAASLLTMSFAITSTISWKAEDAPGAVTFSGGKISGSFTGLDAKPRKAPQWKPSNEREEHLQEYAVKLISLRKDIEEEMSPFLKDYF